MFVNKKVLASAIVGVLFAGNAAAVDFTAGSPAAVAATVGTYAKEIKIDGTNGTRFTPSVGNQIVWELGMNLSPGEVKFVRVEVADHVEFDTFNPIIAADPSGATVIPGSVNGIGTNVVTFSVTADPLNTAGDPTAGAVVTLPADLWLYSSAGSSVKVSLYDTSSQAQQGGTTGLNTFGSFSGDYFAFANSLRWVGTATPQTADVGANPSYTLFTGGLDTVGLNTGLGIDIIAGGTLTAAGAAMTLPTLLNAANSSVTITGDFSFVRSNNGATAYNGAAASRVQAFGKAAADDIDADHVEFGLGTAWTGNFVVGPKLHTATFNPVIAASTYTAKLNPVSAAPLTYNTPVLADRVVSAIDHNGTTLQAPLAQIPDNWISRLILTNTSGAERPFTITLLDVEGGTPATPGTLTGTIPANGTTVIDNLRTVFTGTNRATLVVDIAAPNAAVQGMYQIVNPDSGSISNHVMVRPGTN